MQFSLLFKFCQLGGSLAWLQDTRDIGKAERSTIGIADEEEDY